MPNTTLALGLRLETESKLPKLPWPLPANGDLEVARWYYEPTNDRNGGHWIYVVHFFTGSGPGMLLCLRGKVLADFKSFEVRVWERAQDDQKRYKLARERALRYLGEFEEPEQN